MELYFYAPICCTLNYNLPYKDFQQKNAHERRKLLQNLGDELRAKDPSFLVQPVIEKIKLNKVKNVVVECLRNPSEVAALKHEI